MPAASGLFEWFAKKRGLANGILYSGSSVGGAIIPILMQILLTKFGYRTAVLALV